MTANDPVPGGDDVYKPEAVTTSLERIPLNLIDDDPENFAFRDDDELTDAAINDLAEDIAVNGLTTPLLVAKRSNNRYLAINCHRRLRALRLNARQGVVEFTEYMPVPAYVIAEGASELALVTRAVAANVQQRPLSANGRRKAVLGLKRRGMPNKDIARNVGFSEQVVERELDLAASGCMSGHVGDHNISATHAASLVKAAKDAGRMDDLCAAFAAWVDENQAKIEAEQNRRKEADEDPLSLTDTRLSRYFTAEQAATWKTALEKGLPLTRPSFRFRAQVKMEKGVRQIFIDQVKANVADLSAKDLAKVFTRLVDVVEELKSDLEEKARAEAAAQPVQAATRRVSQGRDALQKLGLAHLLEPIADDAGGEPGFDLEVDLTAGEDVQVGSEAAVAQPAAAEPQQAEVPSQSEGQVATATEDALDEVGEAASAGGPPVQSVPTSDAPQPTAASDPQPAAPAEAGVGTQQ